MSDRIVTVDLSKTLRLPTICLDYAVLCDCTLQRLLAFAAERPGCFIFPFMTKDAEAVDDFSSLSSAYIAKPFYVGNFGTKKREAVELILECYFRSMPDIRKRRVMDELAL